MDQNLSENFCGQTEELGDGLGDHCLPAAVGKESEDGFGRMKQSAKDYLFGWSGGKGKAIGTAGKLAEGLEATRGSHLGRS